MARSRWRSAPNGSGRGSASRSGCRPWPTTRASPRTATASSAEPSCGPTLAERFLERTTAEWLATLEAADIPAGPINDILAAFASPEAVARWMTVELEHPAWGVIRQVGVPFKLSATPASIRIPPPLLGADTDAILAEAGYDADEIRALRDAQRRLTAARLEPRLEFAPPERPRGERQRRGDEQRPC